MAVMRIFSLSLSLIAIKKIITAAKLKGFGIKPGDTKICTYNMVITGEPLYIGARDLGVKWVTKESAQDLSKIKYTIKLRKLELC